MSFLSSPREVDVDRRRHGSRGKKQAEAEEAPALDMLDDFWFFSNSLGGGRDDGKGTRRPPLLPKSPSTSSAGRTKSVVLGIELSTKDEEVVEHGRRQGQQPISCMPRQVTPRCRVQSLGSLVAASSLRIVPLGTESQRNPRRLAGQGTAAAAPATASPQAHRRLATRSPATRSLAGARRLRQKKISCGAGGNTHHHFPGAAVVVEEDAGGDQAPAEVEDDDMNWSKIYEGVLRTRIAEEGGGSSSALHRAPSTPVPYSAMMGIDGRDRGHETASGAVTRSTPSLPRLRHSHSTMESHCRSHTPTKPGRTPRTTGSGSRAERGQPRRDLRSFTANQHPSISRTKSEFLDKKWKSSSALESIEVQGFKDLGFVFDQEELRESLADVLPGLRDSTKTKSSGSGSASASDNDDANGIGIGSANVGSDAGDGIVRRPYLSEAWQHGTRSAPSTAASASAIKLQQADARSAAEMKDQIRMWAQAVACNVRQEC